MKFDFDDAKKETVDEETLEKARVLGTCPICGGKVRAFENSYTCENAYRDRNKCDFRMGRVILQREITEEEAEEILAKGSSPLLSGFVSKRTNRPFSALLKLHPKKGVVFEFPEQERAKKTDGDEQKEAKSRGRTARKKTEA